VDIEDSDIGPLWAEQYPKWKTSAASKTLCMALALTLEDKARSLVTDDDLIEKLHSVLNYFGIPKDQFYEVEKELPEGDSS
jgi:hypothetical protein